MTKPAAKPAATSAAKPAVHPTADKPAGDLVRVFHNNPRSTGSLIHGPYRLNPGGHADVPEDVEKIWLSHTHFGDAVCVLTGPAPATSKKELDEAKARAEAAEGETEEQKKKNAELEERLANMQKLLDEAKKGQRPAE